MTAAKESRFNRNEAIANLTAAHWVGSLAPMHPFRIVTLLLLAPFVFAVEAPKLPGIGKAMQEMVEKKEVAGAVTVVDGMIRLD